MAMVTMPGAVPEKFLFTVWNDAVADEINKKIGKRVALHYEEKVGLPTSCFGETRHFVTAVTLVEDIPLVPGVSVPQPGSGPAPAAPAPSVAPAPPPQAPTAPAEETAPPSQAPAQGPIQK